MNIWRKSYSDFWTEGLKLKLSKCEVFQREVCYLGHVVNELSVSMDSDNVAAIRKCARPTKLLGEKHKKVHS